VSAHTAQPNANWGITERGSAIIYGQRRSCGICGEHVVTEASFLSPQPIPDQLTAPFGDGAIGQTVSAVPGGICLTPPHGLQKKDVQNGTLASIHRLVSVVFPLWYELHNY
jgi:hypothetical protein